MSNVGGVKPCGEHSPNGVLLLETSLFTLRRELISSNTWKTYDIILLPTITMFQPYLSIYLSDVCCFRQNLVICSFMNLNWSWKVDELLRKSTRRKSQTAIRNRIATIYLPMKDIHGLQRKIKNPLLHCIDSPLHQ